MDGEVKGRPDDHVNLEDGLRGESGAVLPSGGAELLVEVVEVIGSELSERDVADSRIDVVTDEPGIPVGRRRPDLPTLLRQPGALQEVAELDRAAPGRWGACPLAVDGRSDRLGLLPVPPDRVPPAPFAAGERVESVVGHDVETVLALHDVGHAT